MGFMDWVHKEAREADHVMGEAFADGDKALADPATQAELKKGEDSFLGGGVIDVGLGVYHMLHGGYDAAHGDGEDAAKQFIQGAGDYEAGAGKTIKDGLELTKGLAGLGGGDGGGQPQPQAAPAAPAPSAEYKPDPALWHNVPEPPMVQND